MGEGMQIMHTERGVSPDPAAVPLRGIDARSLPSDESAASPRGRANGVISN